MGAPCEFEGRTIGLHGRVAFTPADTFISRVEMDKGGVEEAVLEGTMREGALFGENLTLHKEIRCGYLDNFIRMTDTVTNEGFRTSPHIFRCGTIKISLY